MGASTAFGIIGMFQGDRARSKVQQGQAEEREANARQRLAQRRVADVKAAAARRKQLAETKRSQARNVAVAQAKGSMDSSVFSGIQASSQTRQASTVSDAARISEEVSQTNIFTDAASQRAQSFMDSASSAQGAANIFTTASNIASRFDKPKPADKPKPEPEPIFINDLGW